MPAKSDIIKRKATLIAEEKLIPAETSIPADRH